MNWLSVFPTVVAVTALTAPLNAPPAGKANVLDESERAVRIKSFFRHLNSLPENDLRELLLQLRALRRSRTTPALRNIMKVPINHLTEDELLEIASFVPPVDKRRKQRD